MPEKTILPFIVVRHLGSACGAWRMPTPGQFISLDSAASVLAGMTEDLPPELKNQMLDSKAWDRWVRKQDEEIRHRLDTGEEDTLTNLLRFGVTFTKEYRIDREYLTIYGHKQPGRLVRRKPCQ